MNWFYLTSLQSYHDDPAQYLETLSELLPMVSTRLHDEVAGSDLLGLLVDKCIRFADNEPGNSKEVRVGATLLLAEIWMTYHVEINQAGMVGAIELIFTKNCKERGNLVRLSTVSAMFKLIDKFSDERN
jgi:hypothetical protein